MKYDVFISYRREGGRDTARLIQKSLQFYGYSVFFDYDSLQDGVFNNQIFEAIETTPIFLLLLSENSMKRCGNAGDWVAQEIEYAIKHNKKIIPVNIDGKFDGFPEQICNEGGIGAIVGAIQFSKLDMGELFDQSLARLIEMRILPVIKPDKSKVSENKHLMRDQVKVKKSFNAIDYIAMGSPMLLEIPNDYTSIGDKAFKDCDKLISVTIPNSVTEIKSWAFGGCKNLTSINIPNSITSIGSYAFNYCENLSEITIPNSITVISKNIFNYCQSLQSIDIPNTVTTIEDSAFQFCSRLSSITIPDSVEAIGASVFANCSSLTSITIPDSVIWIGEDTFKDCKSLKLIKVSESSKVYNQLLREYKTKVNYDEAAERKKAAERKLKQEAEKRIQEEAEAERKRQRAEAKQKKEAELKQKQEAESQRKAEEERKIFTKKNYEALGSPKDLIIPNYITSIDQEAFSGCVALTSITIPDSVQSIGSKAFCGCSELRQVKILGSNFEYENGIIYSRGKDTIIVALPAVVKGDIILLDSVKTIYDWAFCSCNSVISITIPESVISVKDAPFGLCDKLESINVSESSTVYDKLKESYYSQVNRYKEERKNIVCSKHKKLIHILAFLVTNTLAILFLYNFFNGGLLYGLNIILGVALCLTVPFAPRALSYYPDKKDMIVDNDGILCCIGMCVIITFPGGLMPSGWVVAFFTIIYFSVAVIAIIASICCLFRIPVSKNYGVSGYGLLIGGLMSIYVLIRVFVVLFDDTEASNPRMFIMARLLEDNVEGMIKYEDGSKFVGDLEPTYFNYIGIPHGDGTYTYSNGDYYIGEWKCGKRSGDGTMYSADGSVLQRGVWNEDELIEVF